MVVVVVVEVFLGFGGICAVIAYYQTWLYLG